MRVAIVVKSCQRDKYAGCHAAIRETYGKNLPEGVNLYFVMGGPKPDNLLPDELWFDVDDGYWELLPKVKSASKYIVDNNYDYVYFCDTDSYLVVEKLLQSGFEKYDFSGGHLCGRNNGENQFGVKYSAYKDNQGATLPHLYVYLSGGVGFFVSNRAAKDLAETPLYFHSEDVWVGQVLGPKIEAGEMTAAVLPFVEHHSAWHLNCGYYGGGHTERLNAGDAVRRKHADLGYR
jgi:hypothetical protein